MRHDNRLHRRAAAVLLAAAALPAAAALAQNVAPLPTPAPAPAPSSATVPIPPPRTAPRPTTTPAPTTATPPATTPVPTPAPRTAPRPTTATPAPAPRTTTPTPAPTAPRAPAAREAPDRSAAAPAPRSATSAPADVAPETEPVPPVGETGEAPADPFAAPDAAPAAEVADEGGGSFWPLALLIAGLIAAAIVLLGWHRRRRRAVADAYQGAYVEEADFQEQQAVTPMVEDSHVADAPTDAVAAPYAPVPPAAPAPTHTLVAPVLARSSAAGPASAAPPAAPAPEPAPIADFDPVRDPAPDQSEPVVPVAAASDTGQGRPWLDFTLRPIRAGVDEDDAIVEFELSVENNGDFAAEDVRIYTWMCAPDPDGKAQSKLLQIDRPSQASVSQPRIEAGAGAKVDARVVLPRSAFKGPAILPIVVADVHYQRPDGGGRARTAASFAVGIPKAGGVESFSADAAPGLHEGVEAHLYGRAKRV